jgi:hypothetical protein
MTCKVALHDPPHRQSRPRVGVVLGLLLAGMLATAAAPASAACKGPELQTSDMVSLGGSTWTVGYTCYNNCQVTHATATLIEEVTLIGRFDMLHCRSRCSAHADCYAVSYRDTTVIVDGRAVPARICRIWGRGEVPTVDSGPPAKPGEATVYCRRLRDHTPPWQKGLDLDTLQQDQGRSGLPGPSLPKKP